MQRKVQLIFTSTDCVQIHYANERLPIAYARFGKLLNSKDVGVNPQRFKDELKNNLDMINSNTPHQTLKVFYKQCL